MSKMLQFASWLLRRYFYFNPTVFVGIGARNYFLLRAEETITNTTDYCDKS